MILFLRDGAYDAGIYVYFNRDTIPTQYRFPLSYSSPVASYLENDHSGSVIEPTISSSEFSDSIGFVQGTEGLLLELTFLNLDGLEDVIVNKAEFLVPIASLDSDNSELFPPTVSVFTLFITTRGCYPEITYRLMMCCCQTSGAIDIVFGGLVEAGSNGTPDVHRTNISAWFQQMLKNDNRESDISDVIFN